MALILTATNFSDVAGNAVNYACELATAQNDDLVILHSFIIPVTFSDIPMPGNIINDTRSDAEALINQKVSELKELHPGLNIKGKTIYGDTIDAIEEFMQENGKPWMVVIGNSNTGENAGWLDSTLLDAMKKLKCPVLAIPPGLRFTPVKRVCLAFDNRHTGNELAFQQLRDIAIQLRVELHVLNVQQDLHNQDNTPDFDAGAKIILSHANPHYHFIYDTQNVDKAIQDFTEKNKMDMLIMIPRKHTFFEGLFHKSHTRHIAHLSHIPILALHDN